jgi:hypothetical protein
MFLRRLKSLFTSPVFACARYDYRLAISKSPSNSLTRRADLLSLDILLSHLLSAVIYSIFLLPQSLVKSKSVKRCVNVIQRSTSGVKEGSDRLPTYQLSTRLFLTSVSRSTAQMKLKYSIPCPEVGSRPTAIALSEPVTQSQKAFLFTVGEGLLTNSRRTSRINALFIEPLSREPLLQATVLEFASSKVLNRSSFKSHPSS